MEHTFHMLLYRAFHAQRNYLRPCLGKDVYKRQILPYVGRFISLTHRRLYYFCSGRPADPCPLKIENFSSKLPFIYICAPNQK